jgi:hypothetical protein
MEKSNNPSKLSLLSVFWLALVVILTGVGRPSVLGMLAMSVGQFLFVVGFGAGAVYSARRGMALRTQGMAVGTLAWLFALGGLASEGLLGTEWTSVVFGLLVLGTAFVVYSYATSERSAVAAPGESAAVSDPRRPTGRAR